MSSRPSRRARRDCESSSTSNVAPHVIIGDTAHAMVKARRLLKDGVTQPIWILTEGPNKINRDSVDYPDFNAKMSRRILQDLKAEVLHYIPSGNNIDDSDGHSSSVDEDEDQVVKYYHGTGIVGDFISAYFMPRAGPWFQHSTHGALKKFVKQHALKACLSKVEQQVVDFLADRLNVATTPNFIVKHPAIQDELYTFVEQDTDDDSGGFFRQLFIHIVEYVAEAPNVRIFTQVTGLQFESSPAGSRLYDISFEACGSPHAVAGAKVDWETNPYTFLRLATTGGLNPKSIRVPAVYRAVVPIQKKTAVVDLSKAPDYGDSVSSYVPFALQDFRDDENKTCSISWLGNVYTTEEDFATTDRNGLYASSGHTLMIVEAISLLNRRESSYNVSEDEVQVCFNSRKAERSHLRRFAQLVALCYESYTGVTIDPDTIVPTESMCQAGACSDLFQISNIITREPPMVTMIELGNHLYGADNYPVAGKNRC